MKATSLHLLFALVMDRRRGTVALRDVSVRIVQREIAAIALEVEKQVEQ